MNDKVLIYADGNFSGPSQELSEGSYDLAALTIGNDRLSSLKVPSGIKVTLYEHGGFAGRTKVFTQDAGWVGDDFNDLTSAVKVERVPVVPAVQPAGPTVASDGSRSAVADMSGKVINLSDLIDNLPPQVGSLFAFENAKVILDQDAKRLTFTGTLKMDGPVLGAFKSFLKMDAGPVLTMSIDAEGQSLSTKIRPTNMVFSCAYPAYMQLTSGVTLSNTIFQLQLRKVKDDVTGTESWNVIPSIGAMLTFTSLAATPVAMAAAVTYSGAALQVSAAVDKANSVFGIKNLDLDGLQASFQAGSEANIRSGYACVYWVHGKRGILYFQRPEQPVQRHFRHCA